jgi:hypothetical protein
VRASSQAASPTRLPGLFRFCFTMTVGLDGEIGRHSGLKIRRLLKGGVPVRFRLEAPRRACTNRARGTMHA